VNDPNSYVPGDTQSSTTLISAVASSTGSTGSGTGTGSVTVPVLGVPQTQI